ncbi:MAG: helix-turn-helix transcriptional regulator [Alphaproteobacteria bacterium]|jgi:DNA-binding HxlR family transcriptional regulator|nr:helix-turn-helix transcriptional regulator [Alphaproteobacteria bacterium]QQS57168.1 MAG: helix-turn-helix transcriptional regulator [Alphaproteobacteria bacterium]
MAEPQKKNSEELCFTEMVPDDCPVLTSIRIIGGKWKIPILYTLRNETLRFNELQKALPGVTQKMLTQQLRELEKDGLVIRKVFAQVPPKVEYTITPLARKLEPILNSLCEWGTDYLKIVHGIEETDCR